MRPILLTVGIVGAASAMIALSACGSTGNVPPVAPANTTIPTMTSAAASTTAVVRQYSATWLDLRLIDSTVADGTSIVEASCADGVDAPDGSGTYVCQLKYSDGTSGSGTFIVHPDGSFISQGTVMSPPTG